MNYTRSDIPGLRQERQKLKARYPLLYHKILEVLYLGDPIGIGSEYNKRAGLQYEPEVGTILPRLPEAKCAADVHDIVYEEFRRWFDKSAGKKEAYKQISEDIWEIWKQSNLSNLEL